MLSPYRSIHRSLLDAKCPSPPDGLHTQKICRASRGFATACGMLCKLKREK